MAKLSSRGKSGKALSKHILEYHAKKSAQSSGLSVSQISNMTVNQLSKALQSGQVSERALRQTYTQLRQTAMRRSRSVSSASVTSEFGNNPGEYFQRVKNLTTQGALIREIADVGKYLHSKRSTITGLKKTRQNVISSAESLGFNVNESNYKDFINFMQWFKASEYSKIYDSDQEEVVEVFNSERSGATNWQKAFEAFSRGNT